VVPTLLLLTSARGRLAGIAGLRWARVGGLDLVVPAALLLVFWNAASLLGRDLAGVSFGVVWIVATAAVVLGLRLMPRIAAAPDVVAERVGPAPIPVLRLALPVAVVVSWVLYDTLFWGQTTQLYDLNVYLGSAARWLDGGQPYLTAALTAWPSSARADFFLYPPPLLPVFAALSRLPGGPVDAAWVAFLVGCAYKAYRLLGLPRIWSVALLAFPPMTIGFESGNIASLTFLLFVAGVRAGGALVVAGIFKAQTGLPALWLIRQRRWRGILAGVAALAAVSLVTLPLVGFDSWFAWWAGLGYRAVSQATVRAMYGYSEAQAVPGWLFATISAGFVALALIFRGRRSLAGLGLASIFASPALWPHGFVFALPALLMLENGAFVWLLLGVGAWGTNMWLLFWAGWLAVLAARRIPSGRLHPMAGTDGPWPSPTGALPARRATPPNVRVSAAEPAD
jgi:hypothetical protein